MRTASILFAAMVMALGCMQPANPKDVRTFEDCIKAGYPVIDSYPRQCKTSDGRTITSDMDLFDTARDFRCGDDGECVLVNAKHGFSCCWTGRCDEIDYSMGEWQAVNNGWYQRQRSLNCPKEGECGPAPMCATKQPIGAYKPACINGKCTKMPVT